MLGRGFLDERVKVQGTCEDVLEGELNVAGV